jgi:cytochrome c556
MAVFRSIVVVTALSASFLIAGAAQAQAAQSQAEKTLKYRKSLYQVVAYNFGPMGAMAQGKAPYDAAEFTRRAERVAMIAPLLSESFSADTKGLPNSELKPEMWANRADFDAKLKDMVDRSATLATVAKSGDFARSKAAFFDAANTCKACHDKYKND